MKKLLNLFLLLLVVNTAIAQVPQGVSYQAVARSSAGAILASQPVGLRFSIHDATATGTIVYQETFHLTTTPLGLFSVNVGAGAVVSGSFSNINWGSGPKYLQVEMDAAGGSVYAGMGMAQQMMSVPYSLYSGNGVPGGAAAGDMLYWNGSAWMRIPAGTTGQVLTIGADGMPAWSGALLPVVTTGAITGLAGISATGSGNVSSAGGTSVTAYGICWSTSSGAESVSGTHTTEGSGTGSFTSALTGLVIGTTYYVRAYATNTVGTSYGNEVSFTTLGYPVLTTAGISSITTSSGVGGGNVSADGGTAVTAYGICWNTVPGTESASGSHTTDGTGTGSFTSNLTGLASGTTYYVKAYATSSVGTAYGAEVSFTTNAIVVPSLTTATVSGITATGATGGGNVSNDGGAAVTAYGVCWNTAPGTESVSGAHTTDGSGTGNFTSVIPGLAPGTTYYVRSYATNSAGTAYGTEISFTTNAIVALLTTTAASSVTSSAAVSGGNISDGGGANITARGVCWSTTPGTESVAGSRTTDGAGTGSFTSNITGLNPGITYYVMAYATNSAGTAYGTEISFTTNAVVPALTTTSASGITTTGATSGGNVTNSGGAAVTAYGVCWSTTSGTESVSGAHTGDGSGTGSFTSNITGLAPATTYYVMAYATNSAGTAYGTEISFSTNAVTAPVLTTAAASSIADVRAVSGGNVTNDGGAAVSVRGVCWSTTSGTESVAGSHTTDGTGTGSFTSNITGLTASTTYYVMAYATNSAGTAYGNEIIFTTNASLLPVVTTGSVTGITSTSFTASGNVTSVGGAPVTDRGIIGGFSPGLTLATGYVLPVGSGPGNFDTTVTGVPGSSTLYVKAYATNSYGTVYGTEVSFTTLPPVAATVTTDSVEMITSTSAMGYGHVPDNGGDTVITSGFCWSTTSGGESLSGPFNAEHGSTFSSYITGLNPGTAYYIKGYATTAIGTSFGNELSFTTSASSLPSVVTYSATGVTSSSFTLNGDVTSEGGAPVTDRGFVGGLTSGPTLATGAVVPAGSGPGVYNFTITRSSASTTYYIRSYATNSYGTVYGNENTVTTLPPSLATVATVNVTSITATSAIGGAIISDEGGVSVTARGVCWSTTPGGESASGLHTTDGTGTGTTTDFISGLTPGTTYYVMAYATNSVGTAYGSEVSFTTATSLLPVVVTNPVTGITSSAFTLNGNVISQGGAPVTVSGFVASSAPGGESLTGMHTVTGSGLGSYSQTITNSSGNTTFYLKAYATNSYGTTFGNEMSFTTLPPVLATVTTNSVTGITSTSANSGGNITDNGGGSITDHGVCWSTTPGGESVSGAHASSGGGNGTFFDSFSGLSSGTTYYLKAYVISNVGTSYGNEVSFTTPVTVGMAYGGGTVAYILQPGDPGYDPTTTHGLIASTSDLVMYMQWYNGVAVSTGATGTAIGTGMANTNAIIAAQGSAGCGCYAATLARSYTGGGYTDWYLPSLNELSKLYTNMTAIGGFAAANYWSSTEYATDYAWIIYFATGYQTDASESSTNHVRAVRSF